MVSGAEVAANALNTAAIVLAARNSVHTWWTSIIGCAVFGFVFYGARLYADVTLQLFFIGASAVGWWRWLHGARGGELPIRRTSASVLLAMTGAAGAVAVAYGALLQATTDAAAPFVDSLVLAFSVLGQLLLVDRRIENWWCWLVVNTLAVPLYASRGLYLTAALYVGFWINAVTALRAWRRRLTPPSASSIPSTASAAAAAAQPPRRA